MEIFLIIKFSDRLKLNTARGLKINTVSLQNLCSFYIRHHYSSLFINSLIMIKICSPSISFETDRSLLKALSLKETRNFRPFRNLHHTSTNNSKNAKNRHIFLTGSDRCNSKFSENIHWKNTFTHFLKTFQKIYKKIKDAVFPLSSKRKCDLSQRFFLIQARQSS